MSANVMTVAIQKGGAGKTTTCAALGYLLSQHYSKVLLIDTDGQGNLTELLFQKPVSWWRQSAKLGLYQAFNDDAIKPHITSVTDTLHLVPGSDLMGLFSKFLYEKRNSRPMWSLHDLLAPVMSYYDWILIDTPPALGDILVNSLVASRYVLCIYETGQFCYSALHAMLDTVKTVQAELNPDLSVIGILPTLLDARRVDNRDYIEMAREHYGTMVFENIIKRTASTARLAYLGVDGNPEIKKATEQFVPVLAEILERTYS